MASIISEDGESALWKRRMKPLSDLNSHISPYVSGLIGEREGRKWLKEQGYEVYEFLTMVFYFGGIEEIVDRLKGRRKQEYIEEDKYQINRLERILKGIFGEKFEAMNQFFKAFLQLRKEIWRTRKRNEGIGPDFVVKKNNDFSFVEVKANQSTLSKHQRMCFKIANDNGFRTMVLRIKVESNILRDVSLEKYRPN